MRKLITSILLVLLLSAAGVSLLTSQTIIADINAEAIHEQGSEIYHSGFLFLHAEKQLDLENEDAVILFQRLETRWTNDGRLVQTTKRSILIRTEYGIDHYADLRIPWDSARQKLTVQRLRTSRFSDEASVDAGPTAVVETLPYAVDRAPDYCHLRQTMVLHDGVELPCILETVWTIEDTEPFRAGASGIHSFMGPEPVIDSQFALTLPAGMQPSMDVAGGAPQPTMATEADGFQTWTFEMTDLPARPHPVTDESIRQQPRISWSTWTDWESLATDLEARVASSAVIDDELRTALDEKLENARTTTEKARLVAEFIDQTTRLVGYGSCWWPEPRSAARTWATGYGHRVDRAVLASALYREAGFSTRLAFRSTGYGEAEVSIPGLDWSEGVSLQVSGDRADGMFDPETAEFTADGSYQAGRTAWIPSTGRRPEYRINEQPDRLALRFDLSFDGEKKVWTGSGVLEASGTRSPFNRMSGLGSEAKDYLSGLVGLLLVGAEVSSCNPERFDTAGVTMGFVLELPAGERDTQNRLSLGVASIPTSHIVTLHQETRESDIYLPTSGTIQVELHLDPGDLETVYLPAPTRLENGAGLWQVETSREKKTEDEKGKVVLVQRLQLTKQHYPAAQWPDLRALLLADENRAGRLLLFK